MYPAQQDQKEGSRCRPFCYPSEDLPYPLAVTCLRLKRKIEEGVCFDALKCLIDAFEVGIKFAASVGIAGVLTAPTASAAAVQQIVKELFKYGALSDGAWSSLLAVAARLETPGFGPSLRGLTVNCKTIILTDDEGNFVNWRNSNWGHGAFSVDPDHYCGQLDEWVPKLETFLAALADALAGWALVDQSGQSWTGAGGREAPDPPDHLSDGDVLPLLLWDQRNNRRMSLGPLITLQQCSLCKAPHVYFFDKHKRYRKGKKPHRSWFIDYYRGHSRDGWSLACVMDLVKRLPPQFEWEYRGWTSKEVAQELEISFRAFHGPKRKPTYLIKRLLGLVSEQERGYVHIVGEEGVGKSWLVRCAMGELKAKRMPAIAYYIRAGKRSDYQVFLRYLNHDVAQRLGLETLDVQVTGAGSVAEFQQRFCEFLVAVQSFLAGPSLIVAIDGLDELSEPEDGNPGILDFLPAAVDLPLGVHIVLSSRPRTGAYARRFLEGIEGKGGLRRMFIDPSSRENRTLVGAFVKARYKAEKKGVSDKLIAAIIDRTEGVFLYSVHLASAILAGVFSAEETLPAGCAFYPAYLERLRGRVGEELYEQVYLKILLCLAAAASPVSNEELAAWGVRERDFRMALPDLRNFIHEHRQLGWEDALEEEGPYRYFLAHETMRSYLSADEALDADRESAHSAIVNACLAAVRGADGFDANNAMLVYALRFGLLHRRDQESTNDIDCALRFSGLCREGAEFARKRGRIVIALQLAENAEGVYRRCLDSMPAGCGIGLAKSLTEKGRALLELHQYAMSWSALEEVKGVVEQAGRDVPEWRMALAEALIVEAAWNRNGGRYQPALDLSNRAHESLSGIETDRPGVATLAAECLSGIAASLVKLGKDEEALMKREAVVDLRRVAASGGDPDAERELAAALAGKVITLRRVCRYRDAGRYVEEALVIRKCLVEAGDTVSESALARSYGQFADQLLLGGQLTQSLIWREKTIRLRRGMLARGRQEVLNGLALVLVTHAMTLAALGRAAEALESSREAVNIRRDLVRIGQRRNNSLAIALVAEGSALVAADRCAEALEVFNESERLRRELISLGDRDHLLVELARVLAWRAETHLTLGDLDSSRRDAEQAILLQRCDLVRTHGHLAWPHIWASPFLLCATHFSADTEQAIAYCDEVVGAIKDRVLSGYLRAAPNLFRALRIKVELLRESGPAEACQVATADFLVVKEACERMAPSYDQEPMARCAQEFHAFDQLRGVF